MYCIAVASCNVSSGRSGGWRADRCGIAVAFRAGRTNWWTAATPSGRADCSLSCIILWQVLNHSLAGTVPYFGRHCTTPWQVLHTTPWQVLHHTLAGTVPHPGRYCITLWQVLHLLACAAHLHVRCSTRKTDNTTSANNRLFWCLEYFSNLLFNCHLCGLLI